MVNATSSRGGARPSFRKVAFAALTVAVVTGGLFAAPKTASATPGTPANVVVTLSKKCVKADHSSTTVAKATVTSSEGLPVPGQTVVFGTDGDVTFGSVTDHADGTYTSTVTSSLTPGIENVSATAGGKSGSTPLTESLAAAGITLAPVNPSLIRANGTSTATATATVVDAAGRCVSGDAVTFTASGPSGPTPGATTDNGDGTYKSTITSSTTPGAFSITAHDGAFNSTSQPLTQHGAANTVTLAPPTITLTADGTSTAGLTATVTDSGGRSVADDTVQVTTNGDATFSTVTNNHDGTYATNVKASTTADTETLTATTEGKSGTATLTENPGPANSVALTLTPNSIVANGSSTSAAKATVKDVNNNLIKTETVTFSTNGDVTFGSVTNNNDGTYSSTITASTTADSETITAKTSNNKTGTATLTETAGTANALTLVLNPPSFPANGTSTSTATATLTDSNSNGVPGVTVGFGTNGDVTFSPTSAVTNSSGKATTTITASTTADKETITANGGGKTATAQLTEFGPPNTVTVVLNPPAIVADGTSTSTATATVKDANNNAVLNATVAFSTTGDANVGATTNNGDGTYKSTITASTTADSETITAKTGNNKTGTATLTENPGPAIVTVSLNPPQIPADGAATSTATATVQDAHGNKYKTDIVTIGTGGDATVGPVTNNGDGTYKATITASHTADAETITATDTTQTKSGTATLTETPTGASFHPVPPARILDTRTASDAPALGQGETRPVQVTGKAGVPAGATAVTMNLTATQSATVTFLTVFPSGSPPLASNINVPPGRDIAALVTVSLAPDGSVQLFNNAGTVHAIFDVTGWYDDGTGQSGSRYTALTPARILDTRTASGAPALGQGEKRTVQVTGNGGVPAGATAVVMNVTGTEAAANTYLTVFPSGNPPLASNLNVIPGEHLPNLAVVPLSQTGSVELFNLAGSIHVIFDVAGYFDGSQTASTFTALAPTRILDTRSGAPMGGNQSRTIQLTGKGNVPMTGVKAVILTLTATRATANTFLTVYPSGSQPPVVSNLNVPPNRDIANLVFATVNQADGTVRLYNLTGNVDVIFDVVGWFGP